ncbi:MAG: isocitrate lyase/phosphoenolpyruvate mutase family protein [Chloroflexota bacterium]|jgi:2-methylisocitrate lyase-like PEP mutase family enzyme
MTQPSAAQTLLDLHHQTRPLILPNIWNPIGARLLQAKGFPAAATASAAIAESLGYPDGEQLQWKTMLDAVARIVRSVEIPVSVDIESGYSESLHGLQEHTAQLLDTGAAGLNIEDSWQDGAKLRPIAEQARRIEAIRSAAEKRNIPLVINARADSFLSDGFATGQERIEDAVRRANAYLQAGADCIYPIGCAEQETLVILRQRIPAPINVLFSAKTPSLNALQEIGIKRVSFGPYIFRALLAKMSALFDEIQRGEGAAFMEHLWRGADVQPYLQSGKEPSA